MKTRTIILLAKIVLRGIFGAALIGALLFSFLSDTEPLRIATHVDCPVAEASDYNVFLGTVFVESGVEAESMGNDLFSKFINSMIGNLPILKYGLYDRANLPHSSRLNSAGSGTIVNYLGQIGILTAVHCIKGLPSKMEVNSLGRLDFEHAILGENGADIVFVPLLDFADSIADRALNLAKSNQLRNGLSCGISYFKILDGDTHWTYRKISGDLQVFNDEKIDRLFVNDYELLRQRDLFVELKAYEFPADRPLIEHVADSLFIDYQNYRKEWSENLSQVYHCMEITKDQFHELKGASGSALFNYHGEVIAVSYAIFQQVKNYYSYPQREDEKYYLFFIPVFKLP